MFRRVGPFARQMVASKLHKVAKVVRPMHLSCRLNSDEMEKAKKAATTDFKNQPTIFDKIINKSIPVEVLYEDEICLAFKDVAPQAPVHFLVVPKKRINMIENAVESYDEILGHVMRIAGKLGKDNAPNGFRLVVNNGLEGCQSVYHLHVHVLGGRQLKWPPG